MLGQRVPTAPLAFRPMSSVATDAPRPEGRALVTGWYRLFLHEHRSVDSAVSRWPARMRPLVWRSGPLQTLTLLIAARQHPVIATIRRDPGWRSLLLLSALLHRSPKLVVLHFADYPDRPAGVGRLIDAAWRPVERWALRRAMLRCQVLSAWESELYSQRYGIERERFCFVPFAWRHPAPGDRPSFRAASGRVGVISAGRTSCDWPTLFEAAEGQPWALTVVCQAVDRPLVDRLNRNNRAEVRTDMPAPEVHRLLEEAAVSVIATYEGGISQGHVRLCASTDAGVPVIASRTRSLEGYVEDGRTALLVPPGNASALRDAVNRYLEDPEARDQMAQAAWNRAERWTWEDYLSALSELLRTEPGQAASMRAASTASPSSSARGSRREITLETPSPPIETP